MFWQIAKALPAEDKVKLLKFVTNCSRPPVFGNQLVTSGFKNLSPKFCIHLLEPNDDRLPIAAVCYNLLKLPQYSSAIIMKNKLLQAINAGHGYYII
jgi:ubiquitin-protein ligase E3 C